MLFKQVMFSLNFTDQFHFLLGVISVLWSVFEILKIYFSK